MVELGEARLPFGHPKAAALGFCKLTNCGGLDLGNSAGGCANKGNCVALILVLWSRCVPKEWDK